MPTIAAAAITVVAWGTWVGLAQTVGARSVHIKTLYITVGNLALALVGLTVFGHADVSLTPGFWLPFVGGVVWTAGNFCAFLATESLGIAKAMGIWSPLNVVMSFLWGVLAFGEFASAGQTTWMTLVASACLIVGGILLVVLSGGWSRTHLSATGLGLGLTGAVGAGIFWGSYFVPLKISNLSAAAANLPMALGMLAGGCVLAMLYRVRPLLSSPRDHMIILLAGALWGIGNLGLVFLVRQVGAGRGFTIAQLCILVNALVGIFAFQNPRLRSRAGVVTLAGIVFAGLGGVALGNLE